MANQEDDLLSIFLNKFLLPNELKLKEEKNALFKTLFR